MTPATLLDFAAVNDAAAATASKLEKYSILADYFRRLDERDLRLAVRYAAGRAFAATDERVLGVGSALVGEAAMGLLPLDPRQYHDLCVRCGEVGEALARAWPTRQRAAERGRGADEIRTLFPSPHVAGAGALQSTHPPSAAAEGGLTLAEVGAAFDALAAAGEREAKRRVLTGLYQRCASPREAAYVSKIIFGDLRTGVREGVIEEAIARAFNREPAEVQRCQLLVGDLGETAVLARRDGCSAARFQLFHPIGFMLAIAEETPASAAARMDGRAYFVEDKLDGIRAQVHKSGEGPAARVAIYTRTLDRADDSFPDVAAAVAAMPGDFLLDGEIVPWKSGQVLPFAHIQRRLGRKRLSPKMLRENPAALIAFDILYRDGELLMDRPLRQRRAALHELAGAAPGLLTTSPAEVTTTDEAAAAFDAARARRNEGVVLKDPQSPYAPGRRGGAWIKLKTHLPTLDCVVTAAETGHGKRRNSLSDYTFAVWDRDPATEGAALVNIGKAFSGVSDAEIAQLTERFTELTIAQAGRLRLVEPKVVLEIACDQIQKSARHASGYALRFPRIKRVRWDKRPIEADRLERLVQIYQSAANFARPTESPAPEPEPTLFD